MTTWIGHLRVAEKLLGALPELDETAFAFGNLAPDSGIPNADWSAFDPPKTVTHFLRRGEGEANIHDLTYYRGYLRDFPADGSAAYSFRLGYFFHLLTDNLWVRLVWHASKIEFAAQLAEQGDSFIWELKRDWYDLDHLYLREHPGSLFWRTVAAAPNPPAELPFLNEAALHHSLDYIRQGYVEPQGEHILDRAYPFLNERTMARFVSEATDLMLNIHTQITAGADLDDHQSAIFLLPESRLASYDLPLGDAG